MEGRTDEQIAQALGISTSTVNSYWVRVRGKLGQLSRTEIVSKMLRHESGLKYADLIAQVERLQASERRARTELAQSRHGQDDARGSCWHLLALDHVPDAIVACDASGRIVFANLRAQHLFAAEPGDLETLFVWELTIPEDQETRRHAAETFFDPRRTPRVVVGVERPYYGQRRDGTNFRGLLIAERFHAPDGPMAVVSVREYLHEIETLIQHLRKPFEVL